jgi:hypothetical protein
MPASLAMALATRVLPQPGGPKELAHMIIMKVYRMTYRQVPLLIFLTDERKAPHGIKYGNNPSI